MSKIKNILYYFFPASILFRLFLFTCLSLSVSFPQSTALADHKLFPSWEADIHRMETLKNENLSNKKKCEIIWNILWPAAKAGNLQARAFLLYSVYPLATHAPRIIMPGPTDELAHRRHAVILAIYSIGAEFEDKNHQEDYNRNLQVILNSFLNDGLEGSAFLMCLQSNSPKECTKGSITKLIPSFEDYTSEIDADLSAGFFPKCHF